MALAGRGPRLDVASDDDHRRSQRSPPSPPRARRTRYRRRDDELRRHRRRLGSRRVASVRPRRPAGTPLRGLPGLPVLHGPAGGDLRARARPTAASCWPTCAPIRRWPGSRFATEASRRRSHFTPDGRHLVTGGVGGVSFWDVAEQEVARTLPMDTDVWWLDVSGDGSRSPSRRPVRRIARLASTSSSSTPARCGGRRTATRATAAGAEPHGPGWRWRALRGAGRSRDPPTRRPATVGPVSAPRCVRRTAVVTGRLAPARRQRVRRPSCLRRGRDGEPVGGPIEAAANRNEQVDSSPDRRDRGRRSRSSRPSGCGRRHPEFGRQLPDRGVHDPHGPLRTERRTSSSSTSRTRRRGRPTWTSGCRSPAPQPGGASPARMVVAPARPVISRNGPLTRRALTRTLWWWRRWDSNPRPPACKAGALAS